MGCKNKNVVLNNQSSNEVFKMRPINTSEKDVRPFFTKMRVPWYFDSFLSKGFLLLLAIATCYAIVRVMLKGWW